MRLAITHDLQQHDTILPTEMVLLAKKIAAKLTAAGHTTYFTGGCVRDQLMGCEPKDYDIATSATPAEVLHLFPGSDPIGAHFGVILVKMHGEYCEIATFRNDGSYADSRRPDHVTFSTPAEDAQRRDFTINGIFQNPVTGEIIDYVNGCQDIENKILRAIGEPSARFREDALRLMRAIRFATTLGFDIHPATWSAIQQNAHLLSNISIERVRVEFNKILLSPNRARGLELLVDSGLAKIFLPEVLQLIGCEQPPQFHPEGDVFTHTCIMLDLLHASPSLPLVLSVLLHDIGKPGTYSYDEENDRIRFSGHAELGAEMTEAILRRMKYPNNVIAEVTSMVANHMNFMNVRHMRTSKLKRFMARPTIEDELELHRVDCASSNGITENYDFIREQQQTFASEPLIPPPLITGKDLIHHGLTPGPLFKNILEQIQSAQLEGKIKSPAEAINLLKQLIAEI